MYIPRRTSANAGWRSEWYKPSSTGVPTSILKRSVFTLVTTVAPCMNHWALHRPTRCGYTFRNQGSVKQTGSMASLFLIPPTDKFGTMVAIGVERSTMSVQPEVIKIQSRFGVTTHNVLLKQDPASDKLLIMLPGRAYTCDFPMLYYLRSAAAQQGYDVLSV